MDIAAYNLDAVPLGNGSVFPGNVNMSCASAGMPPLSTCSFTPDKVPSGSGDTNVRLNVVTSGATGVTAGLAGPRHRLWYNFAWYGLGFSAVGIVLAFGGLKPGDRRRKQLAAALMTLTLLSGGFAACGGGASAGASSGSGAGHPGTPPGSYTITVNAVVGSITRSTQVILMVQ